MPLGDITIFVATMTGTAELVADEVSASLSNAGYSPTIRLLDNLDAAALEGIDQFVVISSTYGVGDVPDNGMGFVTSLQDAAPDLSGRHYAVFALGDRTYGESFCGAGVTFDALFERLGAARLTPLMRHDASSGSLPEDEAAAWAAGWAVRKAA
jgi:MioC protein